MRQTARLALRICLSENLLFRKSAFGDHWGEERGGFIKAGQ